MKKRFSAAVLALCLALTLLPTWVLAAESDGTEYWVNMSAGEAQTMLRGVAGRSESRYMVFLYYDTRTAQHPIESIFRSYANGNGIYIYGYNSSDGGSLMDELAPLFSGSAELTLPVAVTWNPSTQTCLAKDNVWQLTVVGDTGSGQNGLRDIMLENGVSHGSSAPDNTGSTPPDPDNPNPPPSTGDSDGASGSSIAGVSEQAWEVLRLLNIYRMKNDLQPLSTFAEVQQAANIRAQELFLFCSHTRPNSTSYETVFQEVGSPALNTKITSWAENIASGQKTAAEVMTSWQNSPGHNANMLKPTGRVHVGIGYDYQTNGVPSLYASNWVQNFVAAYDCSFTNLQLSQASIQGKPGTELETLLKEANIEVTASCYRHGKSSLPLIAAMCSGYDANSTGTQTLTVTYGGQTATLTVVGAHDHDHTWTVSATQPATCTEAGSTTYTCAVCSASKVETLPATGHHFTSAEDGIAACEACGTTVPAEAATLYTNLPTISDAVDMAEAGELETYLSDYYTGYVETALVDSERSYACDILDGHFTAYHSMYEYRVGIKEVTAPLARTVPYGGTEYILVTEPRVLLLNYAAGDPSKETTDVATPNGNVSVKDPTAPTPPEPPKPEPPTTSSSSSEDTPAVYQISLPQTVGGRITVTPRSASKGQRVTVTVRPDSGFALKSLTAADLRGNPVTLLDLEDGTYQFTMPASKVTFTAVFELIPTEPSLNPAPMPFLDVPGDSWFYSSVHYLWQRYLMNGVSENSFAPEGKTSRAMVWAILANLHDVPSDQAPGAAWYELAQMWAVQQGISDGTNPDADVTREQAAAMLWRDAGCPSAAAELSGFRDGGSVSDYARTAICWAVENGIMQGSDGMLNPQGTASRAEMAVMVARYFVQTG